MRNAIIMTLVGIIFVSLITIGVAYAVPYEKPRENLSSSKQSSQTKIETAGYPYLLRTYDGKLAVFTKDLVQPDMVFDVYVRTLPDFDRKELDRGVRVESYDKLTSLIEDYIS